MQLRRVWRRLSAIHLLALFACAAGAPHHHLDPIADLLSDRPSNSGTVSQIVGPGSLDEGVYPGTLVEDESCLACFQSDFVTSLAVLLSHTPSLQLVSGRPFAVSPRAFARPVSGTSSRAPPVLG